MVEAALPGSPYRTPRPVLQDPSQESQLGRDLELGMEKGLYLSLATDLGDYPISSFPWPLSPSPFTEALSPRISQKAKWPLPQ